MYQRNANFNSSWRPFSHDPKVHLIEGSTGGAFRWFNPTHARFAQVPDLIGWDDFDVTDENALPANAEYEWSTRDLRKGRHALVVRSGEESSSKFELPPATGTWKGTLKAVSNMFTTFPYNNISWHIAIVFTFGSVIWVLSSFFAYMPMDKNAPPSLSAYGCGITAFIGSCVFVLGSILLMMETVKDNRDAEFGWAVDQQWDENTGTTVYRVTPETKSGQGHKQRELKSWAPSVRLPTLKELREHYIYEVAFWSSIIQLLSSFVFLVSGITALPKLYDQLSRPLVDAVYWTPKLVACCGFILSALLAMFECQKKWNKPAWNNLGWHIGLWKLIGSVGFILVPCFGFNRADWAQYQATIHCLWGSWAFLICSVLLWYESVTQYTVDYPDTANT
ncbi:hypothetical protein M409DRAFT_70490 [Zasmidium cellare ATCC 36951]|uniref:Uncharacterized protein n=1 Tax=Zasmidium cellare ATCC 36951 TaxID=1080233 RepID=A0A6A6C364_ZASCE|nr:uncharacterized protein M409DRAFT_70490 [Zasmidium cellare ATCC 36951]KAF2160312.1 hypothetical protein M409DRAFT_70490 [Zasmidium cellare ATCC 36951]